MVFKIDQYSDLDFEITKMLDAGKASEIHLAQCVSNPDYKVAIKRCRQDSQNIEEWNIQVEREISALHHLNSVETPEWSLDMPLENRLSLTQSTVAERTIIQLISVFEIDGLPAVALEIAPPSITSQPLDHYDLVEVMHQLAQTTFMIHENGVAFTDFDPLVKIPRIRWDASINRIKIIDWNITRESQDYKRRDIIYLGRIYYQLLTGHPAWSKNEPPVSGLPNMKNEFALDSTGAGMEKWASVQSAVRDVIERLMIESVDDIISSSDQLLAAMDWVKALADLSQRIEGGSTQAINEMEDLLQEVSSTKPPDLRRIVDVGNYFIRVAPESRSASHINQVKSSAYLLKSAYLDRISQAIQYMNEEKYGDAVAELENARSRFSSNQMLTNATEYRYLIANLGEKIQLDGTLDDTQLKDLADKLLKMVEGLESRLWDVQEAEEVRDKINKTFPSNITSLPEIRALFDDIEASKLYTTQIQIINSRHRQKFIDQSWHIVEAQRLDVFNDQVIPNFEKAEQQSIVKNRVTARLTQLRETIESDQKDLAMVQRFLAELSQGSTNIDIEEYLAQSTLNRPHAPLTISNELLPQDQSSLSDDEIAGTAIERYQTFRKDWDATMQATITVQEKVDNLSKLVTENQDMIDIFREKLPNVIIPGSAGERKTVYRDLEDLTQFVNAVQSVYDELASIGLTRIPNINNIQKKWVFVTNVQDPELKQFVAAIQSNLASTTQEKVQSKLLPPELAILVYEILDVPIPDEVMHIGQEQQLHKYVRDTLRQSSNRLSSVDEIDTVIGELERLSSRNLDELDNAIRQLQAKLEQLRDALRAKTIVRQIRSLYNVLKRKVDSDNEDIQAFSKQIDESVDELINQKSKAMEQALDIAKTNEPLDNEQETLVRETQRVIDTLRHNNLLQERRWHHIQNSQAYLLREYSRALEQAATTFNEYQYDKAKQHVDRAFRLSQLFDMPQDTRLSDEFFKASEMVTQLNQHHTMTRALETVDVADITKLLDEEIEFLQELQGVVTESPLQSINNQDIEETFDPQSVLKFINSLKLALAITKSMHDIRRGIDRLRELEKMININNLTTVLGVLCKRLDDLLQYNYTQILSQQITEISEIASQARVISNESVIKRLSTGYMLIDMNKQLNILNEDESNRRQHQLQSNTYTVLKNIHLRNRDEQQALAEFIDAIPYNEVNSRDFQGVLTRLAEDPASYTYLLEQVHNNTLPSLQSSFSRQQLMFVVIVIIVILVVTAWLVLSGTLTIEGITIPY
jgi:hypothetical protein